MKYIEVIKQQRWKWEEDLVRNNNRVKGCLVGDQWAANAIGKIRARGV